MKKGVSIQSYFALNCLILLISGLQAGVGPFLAIYLKSDLKWDLNEVGIAFGIINLAAMLNQLPSGLIIDAFKIKRFLLGLSCLIIAVGCFLISQIPNFSTILWIQFFIGLAIIIIPQAIVAITLGLVGKKEFPRRESVNESLSHAGNIILVLIAGLASFFIGNVWILYIYSIFAISGIFPLFFIKGKEINHNVAREAQITLGMFEHKNKPKIIAFQKIFLLPANIIFFISVFLFHFSSAAQLTLIGQLFVQISPKLDTLFMANSIIVSHLVMMIVAIILRFFIKNIDRKPLFLFAFIVVFVRGVLLTFSHNPYYLIALQMLDGIAGGVFGLVGVVMVAELAANTGRFNFMHGFMSLCQGMAYAMSHVMSGYISKIYGYNTGFYTLASFAMMGFFLFLFYMPETLKKKFF